MQKLSATEKGSISPGYAWYVFVLLFLLYMFDYIDRLIVVSLFPFIKAEWGISDASCGMLVSAVYWSILIFTFPVSILVDRWSRKKTIGIMAIVWSLATAACAFTRNFSQLFVARTIIGAGEAGYAAGGTAMISGIFPREKRARVIGYWNASIPLGSAIGIAAGGIIAEHFGWRHALGIVAVPGFIIAILFFWVRDYKTIDLVKTPVNSGIPVEKMKVGEIAAQFIRSRSLVLANLGFAASAFVTTSLMSWLPSYFHRTEGIPISRAGMKAGAVMFLAVVGAPLGGYLADKWYEKKPAGRMLLPAVTTTLTAIILFISFVFCTGTAQYLVLLAGGITAVAFVPAAVSVTQDVVHPGLRAMSLSICVIIQHILGSTLGPVFVGAVSDRYDLITAMSVLPLFSLFAGILFFVGSFYYEKDADRVVRVSIEME